MGARKLITISLPPPLFKKAEEVAEEENRTKSELMREALRFYVETREVRKTATRERLFHLIGQVQVRTRRVSASKIRKEVSVLLQLLAEESVLVSGKVAARASRDPDDDKFLAAAVEGGAKYLVTGDKDLLVLKHYRGVEIVRPAAFLKTI